MLDSVYERKFKNTQQIFKNTYGKVFKCAKKNAWLETWKMIVLY